MSKALKNKVKLNDVVDVVADFGADPTGSVDATTAFQNAISASGAYGGYGVVLVPNGTYKLSAITLSGIIGLTIKGKSGGSVSTPTTGSVLNFVNTSNDSFIINSASSYAAAKIVFEDIAIAANTTGYALAFSGVASPAYPISELHFNRVTISNSGGTTYNTGNGLRLSQAYYVYANGLNVEKMGSYVYSSGIGVSIDPGSATSILVGEYNFSNCNFVNWNAGFQAGDQSTTPSANITYANINLVGCNFESCSQGALLYYGVKSALIQGCYIEGSLNRGVFVANQAKNVTIQSCFFNNGSASVGDLCFGVNGVSTSYTQFYNAEVRNNLFLNVKVYGLYTYAGAGSNINIENNSFTLGTAGAVAINTAQSASGNLSCTAKNNNFYGFTLSTGSMVGSFALQTDNYEFNSGGTFIGSWKTGAIVYSAFVDFTQIAATDPDTTVMTNTTASARYINCTPSSSRNRKQFITLTAASTQSVRLMKSDATTQLALLTAGKGAIMWNDGTNEYATLLP